MMAVCNIAAFCLLVLLFSISMKEEIVDVLPAAVCILILVLYPLAMLRRLSAIDWIGAVFLTGAAVCFLRCSRADRQRLLAEAWERLRHPGALAAVLLFGLTALLVSGRIAVWWDDINFWATDVKALWALDGFAAKYANAAPEFGDYPPGVQLVKWWFVHMRPAQFSEGLMFTGYYFAVFAFCMPLLRHFRWKNPLALLLAAVCIWAFPSVAEAFYCQGMCADLVMAVVYGAFLASLVDEKGHKASFYRLRPALYLAVLVLIKSVGFLWAAFGLVAMWGLYACRGGLWRRRRQLLLTTAAPLLTGGSWLLLCLLTRRVAKLTGAAVSIAAGNVPLFLPGTKEKLLAAFAEAFVCWPLHRNKTWGIDFSPLALLVLIVLLVYGLWRLGLWQKREAVFFGIFLPVSGLVFYGINLISHLTIFAAETQYLEPFAMVSSIERYGAPFTIGSLYLLGYVLLENSGSRTGKKAAYLSCALFILLSANWPEVYRAVIGYRGQLEQEQAARAEMISEEADIFLEKLETLDTGDGVRVLYLQDAAAVRWVNNAYVAFEAAPVSLIFGGIDPAVMNSGDVWKVLDASHAGFLYTDELDGAAAALFAPMTDSFAPGRFYRLKKENGQLRLEAAEGMNE